MKVLLIDPSADPGPTTLLTFPGRPEGELKTLAGEPAERASSPNPTGRRERRDPSDPGRREDRPRHLSGGEGHP
jgi:hypothetical protein